MPAPALPGFAYDEVKRRYFKIQPNHVGRSASERPSSHHDNHEEKRKDAAARYTEDAVRKRKDQAQDDNNKKKQSRLRAGQVISRPKILKDPSSGGFLLYREVGNVHAGPSKAHRLSTSHVLLKYWQRQLCVTRHKPGSKKAIILPNDGGLVMAATSRNDRDVMLITSLAHDEAPRIVSPEFCPITSLSHDESASLVLVTTLEARYRGLAHLVSLENGLFMGRGYLSPFKGGSVWCSSYSDRHVSEKRNQSYFAIGCSRELFIVIRDNDNRAVGRIDAPDLTFTDKDNVQEFADPDVLAIAWLSSQVVIAGLRNGKIILWDTTAGQRESNPRHRHLRGALIHRLNHGSSICHIRTLDSTRFLVAGTMHRLCMYDLRVAGTPETDKPSTPYLEYELYRNKAHPGDAIAFDASLSLDLIITATDDRRLMLLTLSTGALIGCFDQAGSMDVIRCACFGHTNSQDASCNSLVLYWSDGVKAYGAIWNDPNQSHK